LVGYVTLLSDSIALHESERVLFIERNFPVHHVAALKIGRLGTDNKYKKQGVGTALMKYALGVVGATAVVAVTLTVPRSN